MVAVRHGIGEVAKRLPLDPQGKEREAGGEMLGLPGALKPLSPALVTPPPTRPYSQSSPTVLPTGNQPLKYVSSWGTFWFEPPQVGFSNQIQVCLFLKT